MKFNLRNPIHAFLLFAMACMLLLAQGCATKAVSAEDYVKTAEAQVGGLYRTIGDLKAQNAITSAQGRSYFTKVEALETQVDNAKLMVGSGNAAGGQALAQTVLSGLTLLSAELKAKGK